MGERERDNDNDSGVCGESVFRVEGDDVCCGVSDSDIDRGVGLDVGG